MDLSCSSYVATKEDSVENLFSIQASVRFMYPSLTCGIGSGVLFMPECLVRPVPSLSCEHSSDLISGVQVGGYRIKRTTAEAANRFPENQINELTSLFSVVIIQQLY